MSEQFSFKLVTPEKIFLEGEAQIIVVPGLEGDIGFLSNHTNLITSLRPGMIKVSGSDSEETSIFVDGGFVKFSDNELLVVAEEAVANDQIDNDFINLKLKKYNDDILIANEADKVKISNKIDSLKLLLN